MSTTSMVGSRVEIDNARLGDIELALLGILPDHQLLGGPIGGGPPATGGRVLLRLGPDDGTPSARTDAPRSPAGPSASDGRSGAAVAREVVLVDEESTPIATLVVDGRLPAGARGALLRGRLVP
ncbi:MAG: hypothetical protein ACRCY8_10030, partial [Dermatophilaceae bacterium]